MPERQQRSILLAAFDEAYICSIHTHALGQCFLAETRLEPEGAKICAEYIANVHPQDRKQLRILALRIKIPGVTHAVRSDMSKSSHSAPKGASETRWPNRVTAYDEAHLFEYARLLDCEAAGMNDAEMIEQVLQLHPGTQGVQDTLAEHLERARWMRDTGYKLLLSAVD